MSMPGITGIISKNEEKNMLHLQHMVETMSHEPYFKSGMYSNNQIGIYAGWVCHENSFSDCMPIWNEKKDTVLLFVGENYTDLELFDYLKSKHHQFNRSNANYIVHLYEEHGIDFLNQLNGYFCGLIVDTRSKKYISIQ